MGSQDTALVLYVVGMSIFWSPFVLYIGYGCIFLPIWRNDRRDSGMQKRTSFARQNTTSDDIHQPIDLEHGPDAFSPPPQVISASSDRYRESQLIPNRLHATTPDPFHDDNAAPQEGPSQAAIFPTTRAPPQAFTDSLPDRSELDANHPGSAHPTATNGHSARRHGALTHGFDFSAEAAHSPPAGSSTTDDDGLSLRTSSTLPPSYHTRRSVPDVAHYPLLSPPLPGSSTSGRIPHVPPAPPSAYLGASAALMEDLQAVGWGYDTPSSGTENGERGMQRARRRAPQQGVWSERRRSRDGGIRLEGGHPGSPSALQERDVVNEDSGTRPPSYMIT